MLSEIKVRPFEIKDLDSCVDLYMKTYSQAPWNESWESREVVADFIKLHFENNYFLGFVAIKNDEIVGVSLGFTKPWIKGLEYYIDEFFIDVDQHRQGIGNILMSEIKKYLLQDGINVIMLNTNRDFPAHRFYESLGFGVWQDSIILSTSF
jgi:ribosomal protein S18 acetylase RimI-like enzyme